MSTSRVQRTAPLPPKGARIPPPPLLGHGVRALVGGAALLTLLAPWRVGWGAAAAHADHPLAPLLARLLEVFALPLVVQGSACIAFLGGVVLVGELGLFLLGCWLQCHRLPQVPTTYLRVRGAAAVVMGSVADARSQSGEHFYRAIHQALPRVSWWTHLCGRAPWIACTLTGVPDQPIELGIVVADPDAARRHATVLHLRAILHGQAPTAQIDEAPDPLQATLMVGATVVWHEVGLALAPHYPLRALTDISGSDLLGPLVAALVPRSVACLEVQIVVRPLDAWALDRAWRRRATALLLALHAQHEYALPDDAHRIAAKLAAVSFATTIRLVAVGRDAAPVVAAALGPLHGVLGQYHQRTSHHLQRLVRCASGHMTIRAGAAPPALAARAPRVLAPPVLLCPVPLNRPPDIVSAIEIAGLWHPPTAALGTLVARLPNQVLPAPAEAFTNGDPQRVVLGRARHADGSSAPVGPTWRDLRQMLHVIAGMGAGKTRLLLNVSIQAIGRGSLILLDGKGDDASGSLVQRLRAHIPLADEARLVLIDMLDTTWPIGLNPLAGIDFAAPGAMDQALGQIMAIFARLDAGWAAAPGMQEYVQHATLLVVAGQAHPTLAHIKQALLDARYRGVLLERCTNPEVRTFWTVEYPTHGEKSKVSLQALLRRFAKLLTSETTRYLVAQALPLLDLRAAMEAGAIVLCPLPHQRLGTLASAVGMLLVQAIVRGAMLRDGDDTTRTTVPLIIDELQIFLSDDAHNTDMQTATTQLRGYGIAGIYAHQTLAQLGTLAQEVLTNAGSRVVLRTEEPDASMLARKYPTVGVTAADIAGQRPEEHQYADLLCERTKTPLFSLEPLGWPPLVDVVVVAETGPQWQTMLPPDSPNVAHDRAITALVYGAHAQPERLAARLAEQPEAAWQTVLTRWATIRDYQRAYILAHPGCIPDRMERQRWLSRLGYATPAILAAAEYARMRRETLDGGERAMPLPQAQPRARAQEGGETPRPRAHLHVVDPERVSEEESPSIPPQLFTEEDALP